MTQLHYSYRSCHIKNEEGIPSELRKGSVLLEDWGIVRCSSPRATFNYSVSTSIVLSTYLILGYLAEVNLGYNYCISWCELSYIAITTTTTKQLLHFSSLNDTDLTLPTLCAHFGLLIISILADQGATPAAHCILGKGRKEL